MAEPPLISIQSAELTFGGTPLLTDASLSVFPRDRVCLVGRNGSGKSTLMKIAAGLVEPDAGDIVRKPVVNARYLEQSPDLSRFASIRDYIEDGLVGADDASRIPYLLDALGLSGTEAPDNLSGGEMRRAALIRALAPDPDVLLLDEPTNHLDLPAIEWLEAELGRSRAALVLISHDRRFLENLSRRVVWLDRGTTHELDKSFANFEDWRDAMIEQEALDRHKLARKIHREEHWVTHGVSGRRKRNVRRLKELGQLKTSLKSASGPQGNVAITVSEADKSAKRVVEMKDVSFAYGERSIVQDFDLRIMRGDRLAVIGPNGSGKTTLLKLMTGALDAQSGTIRLGDNLEPLVIDQARADLDPDMSLRDAMGDGNESVIVNGHPVHVMRYLKDFLFRPEQATTPLRALSGGEKARVQLARGLRLPSNLLILDEPTNDLDLETLDLLQEMVAEYPGTVILVSHDRDFIDRLAARTLAYEGPADWQLYPGGYADMARQRGKGVEARQGQSQDNPSEKSAKATQTTKPRKGRSEKMSYKETFRLERLPGEMDALRARIDALNAELADPDLYSRDAGRFAEASETLSKATDALDAAEMEWLELEEKREALEG
ncbi:ATP-binding cassette domain-containing protein [Algimonas porphyrae]|uniref:ABC transporter ATP-binding protein n=1 Tax=Algimonas porphyrae TaxID=1128113 RepID=A0ABQ5V3F2_9PROT|nr:ATP-binding cassette domain-containing protein [Algimonas porphyrae]GLQ21111.1 ABC transporter ATP-binding protein [Algimonas porphyrae]